MLGFMATHFVFLFGVRVGFPFNDLFPSVRVKSNSVIRSVKLSHQKDNFFSEELFQFLLLFCLITYWFVCWILSRSVNRFIVKISL